MATEQDKRLTTVHQMYEAELLRAAELRIPNFAKNHTKLYPSKLPYCGTRALYERLIDKDPDGLNEDTLRGALFGNMGNGVHYAMQRFMGQLGNAIANWTCEGTKEEPHTLVEVQFKTARPCTSCGRLMRHKELKFEDGPLVGKIDFLWVARTEEYGNLLYLVDFKSTDDDRLKDHFDDPKRGLYPNRDHIYAMEAYVPMVEAAIGRKLTGWMLHYMGRNKPFVNNWKVFHDITDQDRIEYAERNTFFKDQLRMSLVVDGANGWPAGPAALPELLNAKPCDTDANYLANYHNFFNPCPLREVCFQRDKLEATFKPLLRRFK